MLWEFSIKLLVYDNATHGLGTGAPSIQVYHEKSIILPDVSRVLACLYEKDIKFETHTASYKSLLRLQASSHAPVPFYDGPTFLEESRGICRYIAEKYEHQGDAFLLGKDALERASVEQWLHNEEHAFNPPSRALYCHLAFPPDEDDGDDIDMHTRKIEEVLEVYEQRLSDSRFLAGNKFTLADLVHLPNSHYITASDKFAYLYDSRKNVSRWWEEISTRKSWQQVLRDMKRVEEWNKQEELKKQQQQQQKEHPRTSGHPIRIYSRKQIGTEPLAILVPPADTVSSSSIVPPLPIDTFHNEALVSSSQSTPTADKTSAVLSKETTVFNAPDETLPTSVQSTPTTSMKQPITAQSIKDDASHTTAKKPPVADAAKSSTKDASIPEPTVKDLHSRHKPSSYKVVSNDLDVFDYYPSHTDEETPYIKPTPRRTSGTSDAFSGSSIGTGHTKTSSISAKEEPDQPSVSDFYKSDSGATGIDSQYKESIPYSGRTPPKFEPADTSASKPHTTDVRHRLQAEQWHTATTGLNDLKQDADHLMSTQQGKPSKDLKQYPSQDSEQATSHPVPEEPMSIELVQRRENITLRPYTDQRSRGIVEDKASSDQRSALLLPSTQEHDATPSRLEAAKDARGRIPSQAGYPGGQDTNKQPRGPASVPRQRAAQDARGTFGESKAADSTISSESFPNATQSSLPRQDLDGARHTTAPFQKRYSGMEDTSKQAKDKISTPWQMVDKDSEDTTQDTKISDSSSSQVQPSYFQRADAPSWKQEITEDRHSATSAIQEKHANVEDTTGISRDVDFKLDQTIGQDDQDTFKETKSGGPSLLRDEQSDTWQAASTLPEQELNQDGRSVAPPSQRRYPSSTRPSKTRYQSAKDASKQPRGTAPTPRKKAAQDDNGTSEESNTADEVASTKQPLNAWRAPISPQIQEVKNSSRTNTSLPKRYLDDDEDLQVADTASASRQIAPDGDNDIFDETKLVDSTTTSAKPLYTQQGAPLPRQAEVEDAPGKGRQSRVTIPEPQKIVARDARDTHGERKTATPEHKTRFDFGAENPYRKDTIDDQKLVPPLLSKEPTSQVQPTSESLQEAASRGGSSTKPSIIEQWQRASVPLNDVTSSSGDDKIGMATIDQKLTPVSQQATPSVEGVNQMAKESGEQRVEQHVPTEAETSGVQSASTSFPGASTAHHATTNDKFAKQSIIDERVGEPTKMQASAPDFAPPHTKRATPDGHEIGDPELVSTPDGQISEAAKTRHDQAILQEDVRDANLRTHNVAKDTFKETKVADSTPSSAKPLYTQRPAPTPRHAELEDTRNEGIKRRETVPDRQKMVERRAGTGGKQLPDRLKAIPPSRQATTEDALGAAGDSIQSPDILDTSQKSRGNYEEAKGRGLTLLEEKSLGAQDAQRTTGESTTPTAGQRKDVSIKPQPDVQDGLKESKLSVADWNGLGSLSSEGKDAVRTETTITGEKPFSTERRRETSKKSESTTPKARPADSQGSVKEQTSSIYQKKPLVAQDSQEQAQTIPVGEKAGGSTPKHQQASDAPNTLDEKLNASEPARAKTHDDFSAEEPYGDVSTDDQKVAPPLLSGELTSQVQPPPEPSHDAALHHIDQWQHASAPLHGQKPTPMKQQESGEERVEPPVPIEAEKSGVQRASPPFPGASVDDHATIGDKFAKQSIIDERVGKPIQMQTSSPDAHPASEPTKRATREGHEIGDLELVSTPDGQISEATKARDDPATVHEDVHDVNLSTHDVGKDTFKETKVAESTPSSSKPMYTQQPAITPSRQIHVGEARDKSMQSRETIPEQQKMVDRKTGISGEQSSDRQKAIRPPRQVAAAEDAPTGDTIQSPYIPDSSNESRGTFEEAIGPGSTLPKAQALDAQDSQLTRGESTMPTADQRKDWKDANNDEEKSFSTERLREMFQESESSTPKTQPTDSQGYSMVDKMSPVYQKGPLPAQESQEEAQIIQAGEKVDSSTPEHQESSGAPYTYDEKLSASAPARADIRDDHSAEEPYKKHTADDQKVASPLSSKEPSSQVQPLSEPLQRADPDGDLPSKSFTIDQWQRTSAPLHGVNTDSGDAEVAMSSNNDQKSTLSSPVPIGAGLSDVGRTAPSLPEAARADDATVDDKFAKQSNIDERVGSPKQMQQPIKAVHPASASTKRTTPDADEAGDLKLVRTPERRRLEAAKATQDPAKIHEDVHDASLSTHDVAIDEKTATYHASGDEPITGYVHDRQARPPASTQAQPTVETSHDPDSSQYVHTGDSQKIESGKPIITDQEATAPIPGSTSMDPQRAGTLPAEVAHSGQRSTLSDKGSARAAQPFSPVEPIKADNNVSADDYTNAPQMIFRQQARPSEPSTIGIPASDTQGVIRKIQVVTPDDRPTDDSDAPQGTEPGQDSAQSVQPPFSTEPTEDNTVVTPPDQTKDMETITHQQAITPAPETAKTTFPGANQEAMAPIAGPTSMDPQLAGTLPAEVAHSDQKPTPSDKGSARAALPFSPVEPIKADSNVSAADYTNVPQMVFRQQARPSESSTIGIPASDTQGVIRKIQEVTPDDRPTDDSGKPFVPSEEQVSYASQAIPGQEEMASLPGATVSPTSDAQVASSEVQEVSPDDQQAVESTTPLFSSGKQGSHVESAFRPGEVGAGEKKFAPSDQELSHSAEQPTSSKPSKEQTVVPTAEQIKEQPTIIDQQNTPYTREPRTSEDALNTTPTHGNVHPAGSTEPDRRPLSVQGEEPKFATQAPPPHVAKDSLDPEDITTDQAMAPIMSPSVPSVAPLGTLPGTNSVQPPWQASMPSTVDLESVPETQHGIPEGEATPAEQKFAISDKEPAHTSESPSSAELRKEEANAAAGDQPNVPQGPETTGRHQVKSPSPDAREALPKDQQPSHAVLPEQTTYAVLPSDLYDRPTPEVDSSVVDKETTLLSSQAQTSAAEPDLTPISGDVSPTSSLQNQDAQPPVTTQAPTTQSLQGSAPTQDDSFRKFDPPRQASTDQVMEPVTSSAAPSDAPQGQDSAQSVQPPFSTEPTEDNTVVTPPDQTKDMETITHPQAITPAPETAKTIFPGANQEAMAPIAGPTSMDPQLAGTLAAEVAHSDQKPTPSDKGSARAAQPVSPVEQKKADSNVSSADYSNAPQMIFRQQARPSAPSTIGIPASDTQGVIGKIQEVTPDNRRTGDSGKPFIPSKEQVSHASQAIPGQEEMASLPGAIVSPTSDAQVASSEVQEVSPDDQQAAFGPGEVGAAEKKFAPSDQELPHSAEQPTSGKPMKEQMGIPTAEQIKEQPTMIDQQNTLYTREPRTSEDVLDTTPSHGDVHPTSIEPDRRPLSVQGEEPKSATEAHPPRVAKDSLDTEAISTNASVQSLKPSTTLDARGATHGELAAAEQKSSPSGQDSAYPAKPPSSAEPRSKEVGDLAPSAHLNSTTEARNGDAIVSAPDQAKDSQTIPGQQVRLPAPSSYTQHPSGKRQEDEPADKLGEAKSSKPPSVSALDTQHVAAPDQVAVDEEKVSLSGHYPAPAPGTQYGTELHNADVDGQKLSPSVQDSVHSVQPSLSTAPTKEDSVAAATDQTSTLEKMIDQNDTTPAPDKAKTPFLGTPDASRVTQKSTDDDHIDEKLPGQGQVSPSRHVSESPEGHSDDVDKGTTPGSSRVETSITGPDSTEIGGDARLSSGDVPASTSFPETQDLQGSAYAKNVPADSLGKFESSGHLSTDEALEPRMSPSAPSVAPLGTVSDKEPAHTSELPSSAEPRKEEANVAAGDQPNVRRGPETTGRHQIKAPSPDAREALRKDQQASRDDDHTSNLVDPLVVTEEKASYAGRASEGPSSEVSSAVDKMMTLPSNQAQTSSTGPESTPISGDTHLSSDVPATSYLQNKEADSPAATQVPTPRAPLESASTQNVLSDAPQDQVSHASEPPFSAEPSNEASYAGRASESREGSPVVDAKTTLPSREVQTASTGSDSTPISGDVPDSSPLQNQEAQPSAATQAPTVQAEGSASTKNELADSLGDIKSLRQLPTDEVVAPMTSFAAPSDSPQGTEPGTNSVQPSEEASFDFSSDEKPTMSQGDQAKTLPNGDLPTSQVVGQSESADSKGMDSLKNVEGASTDENPKMLQQIEQFNARSYKDNNKEADGTVRSSTFEEPQKQSSWPKGSIGSSDELGNLQQTDQAIVQSLEGNGNQAEQTKAHDTETGGPEDMKAPENTNQKNNRISQVETSNHSGKEASGVQRLGESTRDAPNSTEGAPGDVQATGKSKESSRSSEESKVQLQSDDKTGETEEPSSETGQPREGDRPANSYQNNSSQSQAEASDKSAEQSYPGTQKKDRDSSILDDSADPSRPGDMED
ncbi:hypothetical protein SEVIR_2G305100v4 [Setaria viridis]